MKKLLFPHVLNRKDYAIRMGLFLVLMALSLGIMLILPRSDSESYNGFVYAVALTLLIVLLLLPIYGCCFIYMPRARDVGHNPALASILLLFFCGLIPILAYFIAPGKKES